MKSMIPLLAATLMLWPAAAPAEPPADPPAPEGQVVLFKLHAEGVQIYRCEVINPNARALRYTWVSKGADAVLTNDKGDQIGKHYAGPTWEASDGSKVVAAMPPVENAPHANTIPWLLLKAKSTEGDGRFGKVTYIRRVDTEGGAAPTDRVDPAPTTATSCACPTRRRTSFTAPNRDGRSRPLPEPRRWPAPFAPRSSPRCSR